MRSASPWIAMQRTPWACMEEHQGWACLRWIAKQRMLWACTEESLPGHHARKSLC